MNRSHPARRIERAIRGASLGKRPLGSRPRRARVQGQAAIEFVFVFFMLIVLLFGLIDFGRAIYERQVLVNISREGSNLAARGATNLMDVVNAMITSAAPLNINAKGRVIVTSVINSNSAFYITGQASGGSFTNSAKSHVGTGVGRPATLPATAAPIPPLNQTLYVTEVFYKFTPVTPIGKLMRFTLPSTNFYDAAYFGGG